ncbi:E3 ubiquitin-protein ligase RSL1 [Typha latifolia]|uniref:E3 ubiquitin-protein ligase RSL1 n=1 Tax=Typha latifolia TaxID=4733 RepID=UPI003C2F0185
MESLADYEDGLFDNPDVEEEFRSCCAEDEEWKDTEESLVEGSKEDLDEFSLRMFFKGVSVSEAKGPKISGIGVVMERSHGVPALQVQKKLDFYVEELVAEHLALMDGLLVALQNGIRKVYAFTSSEKLYFQIAETEILEDQLLVALAHRILELAEKLEDFDLMLVPSFELERPSWLAQEAIGIKDLSSDRNGSVSACPICCEENQSSQMIQIDCSHKFCSGCLITYVEGKIQASHVPIRCPQVRCKYNISTSECKSFLPVTSYELLERASMEVGLHNMETLYCPFPNCSMLLNASQHLSSRASSSSLSDVNCVECPECCRDICISCGVPWHTMMTCNEYQSLPAEERDAGDMSLHLLAQNNRWRRCQQCRRMIELTQGCYHMTCWCGHEFCYSCGSEYRNGLQTCQCAFWNEDNVEPSVTYPSQESEMWTWDSFDTMPEGYSEQERAQLALIQRFLTGGFSLSDHPCQSPPRCSDSYIDTMKDLHQLPWLERFVSVISDSYNEDFIQ